MAGRRRRTRSMASARSLLIEQQTQPLLSSSMSSPVETISSPSIPISPTSFTMTATRSPSRWASRWFTSVVFPLPRKPVTMVTGTRGVPPSVLRRGAAGIEGVGRAYGGLAHRIAERLGERVEGAPAGAMPRDDMPDVEGSQPFDRLRDDALHDAAEMQAAHDGMDRNLREEVADLDADIDDPGMGAGAEDDQPKPAHMHHDHALVHQEGIGLPRRLAVGPRQVIHATLLEGGHARDLAAVVEMAVEQQPLFRAVHDRRPARFQLSREWDLGDRHDLPAPQLDGALAEHAGVDMARTPAALSYDRLDRCS